MTMIMMALKTSKTIVVWFQIKTRKILIVRYLTLYFLLFTPFPGEQNKSLGGRSKTFTRGQAIFYCLHHSQENRINPGWTIENFYERSSYLMSYFFNFFISFCFYCIVLQQFFRSHNFKILLIILYSQVCHFLFRKRYRGCL